MQQQNKLFVGSLAFSVDDTALAELFAPFGEIVSAKVATDRDTGRSRGFGFVEFTTPEAAQAAISALNGKESNGRQLTVNVAKPMGDRPNRGGGGGGNNGFRPNRNRY